MLHQNNVETVLFSFTSQWISKDEMYKSRDVKSLVNGIFLTGLAR